MPVITFDRKELLAAIIVVGSGVGKQSTMPVLQNLLIETTGGVAKITATDLEVSISVSVKLKSDAVGNEPSSFLVPSERISKVLSENKGCESVTFDVAEKWITVKLGSSRYGFGVTDPKEFPTVVIPELDKDGGYFQITAGKLLQMFNRVVYAKAAADTKFAITGVSLSLSRGVLRLVATDTKMLAVSLAKVDSQFVEADIDVLVPPGSVQTIEATLRSIDKDTLVSVQAKKHSTLHVYAGDVGILSRLLEGRFPPYKEVMVKSPSQEVELNTESLLDTVKKAAVVGDKESRKIKMTFGSTLVIESQDSARGQNSWVEMKYPGINDEFSVMVDPDNLKPMLAQMKDYALVWQLPEKGGKLQATIPDEFIYVVMGMGMA